MPDLVGSRTLLRQPRPEDVETRLVLGADPEVARMFGAVPAPVITRQLAEQWYERLIKGRDPYSWVIEHEGRFISPGAGNTRLATTYTFDKVTAGRGVGAPRSGGAGGWGPTRGGEAARITALRVIAYNTRAIACYRKCGFVEEGRERVTVLVEDRWHDDVMMGLLEHEYRALAAAWAGE